MTFPLAGLGSSTATKPAKDRNGVGRDQFLELLVAQLKHQDPLSPLQADQFAAQLAQFSTVEQLTKLNQTVALGQENSALDSLITKTNLGASLIGKHITAEGDIINVSGSGTQSFQATIGNTGGKGTLTLFDPASGTLLGKYSLGTVSGGTQTITLPPGVPGGTYRYQLDVLDGKGTAVPVKTFVSGVVDGVTFESGTVWLTIGATRVPLDHLSQITP
jgi:flagellar basal-body rod modification protein FlgD